MKLRTTWLLLLAVCLAGGVYWWIGGAEEAGQRHRQEVGRAFAIRSDQIVELVLDRSDLRIECRRVDGVWRIVVPVNARADASELDRMLTVLSELRRGTVITAGDRREAGLTLADYGLERPEARIEWSDGTVRRVVRIGRPAPLGNTLYVMLEGTDDVLAVPQTLLDVWPDSVVSLRDRILFHGDPRRAYRAEVRRAGGFLQLQRAEDGSWRIQQPLSASADPVAVRQWIDRLFELRIVEFMADVVSDPSVYGLDESATQITLWTEGQPAGQTLWLGVPIDAQSEWIYARRHEGDSVFAVAAEALTAARVRPSELRNRTLVSWSAAAIGRIQIEQQDERVSLRREGADWFVEAPQRWRADAERVDALLSAWTGTRIERFIDAPEEHEAYAGMTTNALRIRLSVPEVGAVNGAAEWRDVELVVSELPASDRTLLVQRNRDASLYEVDQAPLAVTVANPLYYWDRQIMDVTESEVTRVRQIIHGVEADIAHDGSGQFVLQSPVPGGLETNVLRRALARLRPLQVDEFVLQQPADWAVYGLADPAVVWTLRLQSESGLGRVLRIGNQRPDGRAYARTLGYNTLFLLSAEDTDILSQAVLQRNQEVPTEITPDQGDE